MASNITKYFKRHPKRWIALGILLVFWVFCLPSVLFNDPTSTVVESTNGDLIGARIASDGQWRFPAQDSVPYKFEQCIVQFEDAYFYSHPGFNPVSMTKAVWNNLTTDTRRGGSTLTQQVIRLSRKNKKRNYSEKLIELFQATRLEAGYSKKEILNFYASYAPFGGNVVGLETAAWRYFGLPSHQLSWGQTAALAVLPNAPALIFPGRNQQRLKTKRDALLKKLHLQGIIDQTTYELSLLEPLPSKPKPLPEIAPHFTELIKKNHAGQRLVTSIDYHLQARVNQLVAAHYSSLKENQIHNIAVLILDVENQSVLSYVGNSPTTKKDQSFVDVVQSPRSTGSILKPFLYANMLDSGRLLPDMLVPDIPTSINGYSPANFDNSFNGALPASEALSRSLNIPAVRMLEDYGLQPFYNNLKSAGLSAIKQPANHYGLSLILGGAESSLWEITNAYASMAQVLNFYTTSSSEYKEGAFDKARYTTTNQTPEKDPLKYPEVYSAASIYHTFTAMQKVNRPFGQENWSHFENAQPIAWKTGTSYGFKDAWAVGVTPKYAIGIWVGNADGEGRPGLTGIQAAAPILFDVLTNLPTHEWFATPFDELQEARLCLQSGHQAGPYCDQTKNEYVITTGLRTAQCPYHEGIFLDRTKRFRVNTSCLEPTQMVAQNWFSLPPFWAHYYASKHPEYKPMPPFMAGCDYREISPMEFIFPTRNEHIIVGKDFDGKASEVVFKVAHQDPDAKVYWYLDHTFIGATEEFHELALLPSPGTYVLSAMDQDGNELKRQITIQ
ncbi:MAG: penicillin-binding protein 1C [Gilvibacter sp.]